MLDDQTDDMPQDIAQRLNDLTQRAQATVKDIDETNAQANIRMDQIESDVNQSVTKIKKHFSALDKAEAEAGDQIDQLVMNRAEDIATDDFDEVDTDTPDQDE